jgi:tRNA(fMet)-specific endonuclease VapC
VKYLLDTNVISELVAGQPNEQVIAWIDGIDDQLVYLSVITIGEIKRGIEKLPNSRRKRRLNQWLNEELLIRFDDKILSIDIPVMVTWGKLIAKLESRGRMLPAVDSLIAATALHHGLHLVTRNEEDFDRSDVMVINPWLA